MRLSPFCNVRTTLFCIALASTLSLGLAVPSNVSTAYACTGGSAAMWADLSEGWHYLTVETAGTSLAPTDAVFVLRGKLKGLDTAAALAQVTITVNEQGGGAVPGSLELIDHLGAVVGLADLRDAAIAWRPDQALVAGKKYQVTWQVGSVGSTAELTIGSSSQPPMAPSTEPAKVVSMMGLTGPFVECYAPENCGPGTVKLVFHQGTKKALGLGVEIQPGSAAANASYQTFELTPVAGKGNAIGLREQRLVVTAAGAVPAKTWLSIAFDDDLPEYCVKLTTTDLRDGTKSDSADLCAASAGSAPDDPSMTWEGAVGSCDEPPHPDLLPLWCSGHGAAIECGGSGEGGSAGAGGKAGTGASAGTGGSSAGGGASANPSSSADSGGCVATGSPRVPPATLCWLVVAAGALRFRRRAVAALRGAKG